MESIEFKNIEKEMCSLFGEKAVITVAQIRVADKGYIVRISVLGLPFEISSMAPTLEEATSKAIHEFEIRMPDVCRNDLFKTQPEDKYVKIQLSDEELDRLYRFEDELGDEFLKQLKEETNAWVCQLDNNKFECVIEGPYKNLHSRGVGIIRQTAILSAIMKAHEIFNPELVRVGEYLSE